MIALRETGFEGSQAGVEVAGFQELAIDPGIGGHGGARPEPQLPAQLRIFNRVGQMAQRLAYQRFELEQIQGFSVAFPRFTWHTLPPTSNLRFAVKGYDRCRWTVASARACSASWHASLYACTCSRLPPWDARVIMD